MPANEFVERRCPTCGEALNVMKNDIEVVLRCTCEWKKGVQDRIKRTIHPTFYQNGVKRICHWRPPCFDMKESAPCYRFVKGQKILAIKKIYDFCFNNFSLEKSIITGRNIFIRGPKGSGRGLLIASMKFLAAGRDISVTPYSGEWAIFKAQVIDAESMGKPSETAKAILSREYLDPEFMTLENIKAEPFLLSQQRKIRGSSIFDLILAKRQAVRGAMAFSSSNFVGEIADTFGDKFYEVVMDDKTDMVLLLSPEEVLSIIRTVKSKLDKLDNSLPDFMEKFKNQKKHKAETNYAEILDESNLDYSFLLECMVCSKFSNNSSLTTTIEGFSLHNKTLKAMLDEIEKSKQDDPNSYERMVDRVSIGIIKQCKVLAEKMTDKEIKEVVKILWMAASSQFEEERKMAISMMNMMSGLENG